MTWSSKIGGKKDAQFLEYRSALRYADEYETPEEVGVIVQWKRHDRAKLAQWLFGLYYRTERIYALDVQPWNRHKNNSGVGRPLYKQFVDGSHEHTWSDDGYGYAEPIELKEDRPDIAWTIFQQRAGIIATSFDHPDMGQPDLI